MLSSKVNIACLAALVYEVYHVKQYVYIINEAVEHVNGFYNFKIIALKPFRL